MPSVQRNRKTPTIHVSSRGYLWAPQRKTWIMCNVMTATIALQPHKWTAGSNHPADARGDLKDDDREGRAGEDIPPARRAAVNRVIQSRRNGAAQARSLLEPP